MPRNGSGTYSLPQSPFVPGTTISSAAVNSDFSDIATALTDSVAYDGQTVLVGVLKSSVAAPQFVASSDNTSGVGFGVGTAGLYAGGVEVVAASATGAAILGNVSATGAASIGGTLYVAGDATIGGNFVVVGSQVFTGVNGIQIPDGTTTQRTITPGLATIVPGTGVIRFNTTLDHFEGFDGTEWVPMSNITDQYTITASLTAGNTILNVSLLNAQTGQPPSTTDPLRILVRDPTIANGDPITLIASGPLTINTNATGATLGTTNNTPFRFWLVCFDNGGSPVLGLINCSTPTQIYPLMPANTANTTGISAAATSAGVFYTPNGTSLSNASFTILGYLEYASGLSTGGTYSSLPTKLQIFNANVKLPGAAIQRASFTTTGQTSFSGTSPTATSLSVGITPTSVINIIEVNAKGPASSSGGAAAGVSGRIYRNTTSNPIGNVASGAVGTGGTPTQTYPLSTEAWDQPGSIGLTTYVFACGVSGGTWLFPNNGNADAIAFFTATAMMTVVEYMG